LFKAIVSKLFSGHDSAMFAIKMRTEFQGSLRSSIQHQKHVY